MRVVVVNTGPTFEELANQAQQAVEQGLNLAAYEALADFEKTTATWEHKPSFTIDVEPQSRTIGTDDEVYQWVNDGTRRSGFTYAKPRSALWLPVRWLPKTRGGYDSEFTSGPGERVYERGVNLFKAVPKSSIESRHWDALLEYKFGDYHGGGRLAEIIEQELSKLPE